MLTQYCRICDCNDGGPRGSPRSWVTRVYDDGIRLDSDLSRVQLQRHFGSMVLARVMVEKTLLPLEMLGMYVSS